MHHGRNRSTTRSIAKKNPTAHNVIDPAAGISQPIRVARGGGENISHARLVSSQRRAISNDNHAMPVAITTNVTETWPTPRDRMASRSAAGAAARIVTSTDAATNAQTGTAAHGYPFSQLSPAQPLISSTSPRQRASDSNPNDTIITAARGGERPRLARSALSLTLSRRRERGPDPRMSLPLIAATTFAPDRPPPAQSPPGR